MRRIASTSAKRVSIAETTLSGSPLQCWDNSTRGLDSATALDFSVAVDSGYWLDLHAGSIASQSAYDLFDKGILRGPSNFLWTNGERKGVLDQPRFRLHPSPNHRRLPDLVDQPCRARVSRTPDEFARVWRESAEYQARARMATAPG
ncbi:hypothetical protein B0H14DRAFT_3534211 [Mycena olivaceomarginata]|nr:hypothetical protein B0H14DRAFT_3534211 [Mycena olivaceomarginata]